MLADGTIMYSAGLPQDAIAGHAVTMTAESLLQSRSAASAQGHPITFSGGSVMDSGSSLQRLGRVQPSRQEVEEVEAEQPREYYPVVVADPDQLSDTVLQGAFSTDPSSLIQRLCMALISGSIF